MAGFRFLSALGRALDPKRDFQADAPRPLLVAKLAVEYVFKIAGFFVLLCLFVGMTLASCPESFWLATMPLLLGALFCFYIAITTLGIPLFMMIAEIDSVLVRRIVGYAAVLLILVATFYTLLYSPIFELLVTYVSKLFPEAFECETGLISL